MIKKTKFSKIAPTLPKTNSTLLVVLTLLVLSFVGLTTLTSTGFVTYPSAPGSPSSPSDTDLATPAPVVCTNTCQTKDVKTCNGNGYQVCGDYNGDGCLELSSLNSCQPNQICQSGSCLTTCVSSDFSSQISPAICPQTGKQTKTWSKIGSCQGTTPQTEEISCSYVAPTCTEFSYSEWGACVQSGTQTRLVTSQSPAGCMGSPITTRSCNYIPPCTDGNWQFTLSPSICPQTGKQTKTWSKIGSCQGTTPQTEEISCSYVAPTCTEFSYSEWSSCQPGNMQTRSVTSQSPASCAGGMKITTQSCTYITPCSEGQIISCDNILNGVVTGHKNICKDGKMTGENTCQTKCNSGFTLDVDRCVQQKVEELSKFNLLVKNDSSLFVNENSTGKKVLEVLGNTTVLFTGNTLDIQRSALGENREYIIVKNISLNSKQTKTVYLEKKNQSSNAVCFKDSETDSLQDILNGCVQLMCPGKIDGYSCEVENNIYSISGLHYSGVVEDTITCGDLFCSAAEDCNSCSLDCGVCNIQNVESNTANKGRSGGGGGASSGTQPTGSNQISKSPNVNKNVSATSSAQNSSSQLSGSNAPSNIPIIKAETGSSFIWYAIGTMLLLLTVIIFGMLIKHKIISKRINEISEQEVTPLVSNNSKITVDPMTSEINNLLSLANSELSNGNVARSRELYEEIQNKYNSIPNKNPLVYQQIIELYNKLISF